MTVVKSHKNGVIGGLNEGLLNAFFWPTTPKRT
jgi:hypothetical protein